MDKDEVVESLKEMADLLEIVEASRFEYMAFRNAASALDDWSGDLNAMIKAEQVTDIATIGKSTAKLITDLMISGTSNDLEDIRNQVPEALPQLLRFRGLGPKRVKTLWKELGIESTGDLEAAIDDGRLAKTKGFGTKTIATMQASIKYFKNTPDKVKAAAVLTDLPDAVKPSGKIYCGTSGFSYPQWKGNFFPENAKTADLLQYYSGLLPSVEINNTFYRFPSEKVIEQWKSQTPSDFQFALKAHRRVTHQMRLNTEAKHSIRDFVARCGVLGSRLGCILFQLPPDFEHDNERLGNLLSALPAGPRYSIEFRHKSWINDEVLEQLQKNNIACVSGDSENSSPVKFVSADFVYARLRKTSYTAEELNIWNEWFIEQQKARRDVLVYLKHDDTGDAPNAVKNNWCETP